ncbi:MAG TPA: hypothetical protein VKV73_12340 [Chloroflexota bacterium]|nr:hypothetical protein [Chloroflexota bacterium]
MNLLGRAAQVYVPKPVRKLLLTRLLEGTAAAFTTAAPAAASADIAARSAGLGGPPSVRPVSLPRGLSAEETLHAFRDFTAQVVVEPAAAPAASQRLFDLAYGYGQGLRRALGVASANDAMAAARVLYGILGIDFTGDARGEIIVSRCFFSRAYTPEVCKLMSSLDAGLLAGLADGGKLVFSQRITEGSACCRARLVGAGATP